jgi:hypothetical protein
MPGALGGIAEEHVKVLIEGKQLEAEAVGEPEQTFSRIERQVAVARAGVPPIQADLVDVIGLKEGGEHYQAGIRKEIVQIRESADRIGPHERPASDPSLAVH